MACSKAIMGGLATSYTVWCMDSKRNKFCFQAFEKIETSQIKGDPEIHKLGYSHAILQP